MDERRRHRGFRGMLRLALVAYPGERRRQDADEIEATAVRALDDRTGPGRVVFAVRILVDVVGSGLKERSRERSGTGGRTTMWSDGWMDLKVAARSLWKAPGFSVAAVVVLALGIGANTVVFSAVRSTLLTPPPYPDPDELVLLELTDSSTTRAGPPRAFPWSYPKFLVLEDEAALPVESAAAFAVRSVTLTGSGNAQRLSAELVTPGYFGILGAIPSVGRAFSDDDNTLESSPVTILGHGLWVDRFGGDRSVVGRDVILNGQPVTVVGIAPPGFDGLSGSARLWLTVADGAGLTAPFLFRGAQAHWLRVVARSTPGADLQEIDARMREVGRRVEAIYPTSDPTVVRGGSAVSLAEATVNPQAETALFVLAAASLLLLLVACTNLAGLLVARAHSRSRDAAVRSALGAGRWRVARGRLLEALVLAVAGGLTALVVTDVGLGLLGALWPDRFADGSWNIRAQAVDGLGIDGLTLAFTVGATVAATLLLGVIPALVAGGTRPAAGLQDPPSSGRRPGFLGDVRSVLVAGEMALALVLIVGAGLLLRSLAELSDVERGFTAESLVTFDYALPRESAWSENPVAFHEEVLRRLEADPAVESAALTCVAPLAGHCIITGVRQAGGRTFPEGARPSIGAHFVSDGFFRTLGAEIVQGRGFTSEDQEGTRPVVVLSEAAVRELFPDDPSPIGRRVSAGISLTPEEGPSAEVVGVVEDILFDRPANGIMPELFVSYRQQESGSTVVARPRGNPGDVVGAARAILADLDPDVPLFGLRTLDELEAAAAGDTRILGHLLTGFALLALLLACTGVWAIVSFSVSRRTREIGVRVALGADAGDVVRSVQKRGMVASVVGLVVGAGLAYGLSGLLGSLLYGVESADPLTFLVAALLLAGVSLMASWLPARRATRVDPMVALRAE